MHTSAEGKILMLSLLFDQDPNEIVNEFIDKLSMPIFYSKPDL